MRHMQKMERRLLFAEISRTQDSEIPDYGRNLQNLRNSGVTAGRNTIIRNQGGLLPFTWPEYKHGGLSPQTRHI